MSEHVEQPQDEPRAAVATEPAASGISAETASEEIAVAVGHVVRLESGEHVVVHGVRRSPLGLQIMRAAGVWLDAHGIEIVPQD